MAQVLAQLSALQILLPTVVLVEALNTAQKQLANSADNPDVQPSRSLDDPAENALEKRAQEFSKEPSESVFASHAAVIYVPANCLDQISDFLHRAITQFLQILPSVDAFHLPVPSEASSQPTSSPSLMPQHQRLAQKLKERLGYLGVYYKRNPEIFFRNLSPEEKQEFLDQLKLDYKEIILSYFTKDPTQLNQEIDAFVNTAFFTDISVSQIVETHMEIMDEFSKQLRLEGRSEEILLDYRLTLIDIIAHLCEMYRRSIPRES
nr:circadian clock protein KaiA [Leptolyngbya sp. 'hensonii']